MSMTRVLCSFFVSALLCVPSLCQTAGKMAPLPGDPLELATGPTAVIQTPQQRQLVLGLFQRARQNFALHAQGGSPYSLKVSFESSGQSQHSGPGEMEENWANGQSWRWSVQMGGYSQTRIFHDRFAYDEKPAGPMPLRLQMLRSAIFAPLPARVQGLLRVASAKWNGFELMCVLHSGAANDPTPTPGRRWVETEYCFDPKTSLLHIWSEAPGIYTVYDYTNSLNFHGHNMPRQISVIEGGEPVLRVELQNIQDGVGNPNGLIPTAQMLGAGPGNIMTGAVRFPVNGGLTDEVPHGTIQPVIVHAIIDEKGKVVDAEALPGPIPALNISALQLVEKATYPPGLLPTQREAFINVRFASAR
ncbi:MAG: hypothetical protein JWO13_2444 [Acidobacteriales bacterium]|nr:hypothetical protein [Terriglobales bacterium]